MKQSVIGIVAHVDAGKTTLTESILYHAGIIRKMGRVDNQDAFLDYDYQEKDRGITIYAKMCDFKWNDCKFTLLDTPGHIDFATEMERCLQVLDQVILVISGSASVQPHSETIWNLLKHYNLPVSIFVNKMDNTNLTKDELLEDITSKLSNKCIDFSNPNRDEQIALSKEGLLDDYLNKGYIKDEIITEMIFNREIFPVYFGSALKDQNIVPFLDSLEKYTTQKSYPDQLGLRIFKVNYDDNGTRWCYCKVTGGQIKAKEKINDDDKIDQIRLINGRKSENLSVANAGSIVAIKGLNGFSSGQGIGIEKEENTPVLSAYMNYRVLMPSGCDEAAMYQQLKILEDEDPQIKVTYNQNLNEIYLQLMGEIQIEIIHNVILKRTGISISFDEGTILYKETIAKTNYGYGHYEPLRHYAEVHVRLDPLPFGSGMQYRSEVSTDDLALNWQRLILTHMAEKQHVGVLTGSPITDIRLTLIAGKDHLKHTEGGDFRQATYRAIRNGLKTGESILLEPYYNFVITISNVYLSKILYDLERMNAEFKIEPSIDELMILKGKAPISKMRNYNQTLLASSQGKGKISFNFAGYYPVSNQQEIVDNIAYDSEADIDNPTGSIFCSHGAGFYVPYDYVESYIHLKVENESISNNIINANRSYISQSELQSVFANAGGKNKKQKEYHTSKKIDDDKKVEVEIKPKKPKLLVVDGYNFMHAFYKTANSLNNLDAARDIIIDEVSNYAGYEGYSAIVVFDAYKVADGIGHIFTKGNISVVYTKASQTADSYIEKMIHDYINDYDIIVVTSDQAVQNMVLGNGAIRKSSRELNLEIKSLHND